MGRAIRNFSSVGKTIYTKNENFDYFLARQKHQQKMRLFDILDYIERFFNASAESASENFMIF